MSFLAPLLSGVPRTYGSASPDAISEPVLSTIPFHRQVVTGKSFTPEYIAEANLNLFVRDVNTTLIKEPAFSVSGVWSHRKTPLDLLKDAIALVLLEKHGSKLDRMQLEADELPAKSMERIFDAVIEKLPLTPGCHLLRARDEARRIGENPFVRLIPDRLQVSASPEVK